MTIELKEDIAYILLKKMGDRPETDKLKPLNFSETDFTGRNTDKTEVLAHIDYLNQKGYINADFKGDAYADSGPNPLPSAIEVSGATLTASGKDLLNRMTESLPEDLRSGPSVAIATKDMDFLKKVMLKGNLETLYDARDITEVVFRTMRDLMPSESTDRVASELKGAAVSTNKKALQEDISTLWKDSNPLVRFLSEIRPTLNFDDKTFLYRVEREGGIPKTTGPKTVLRAVFSATKDELSPERVTEISAAMPGTIRKLWHEA